MKNIILLPVLILGLVSVSFTLPQNEPDPYAPELTFYDTTITLQRCLPIDYQLVTWFYFVNTGKSPLKIRYVDAPREYARAIWPQSPVQPGKMDSIHVWLDSRGRNSIDSISQQYKVISNSHNGNVTLTVKASICRLVFPLPLPAPKQQK